jgi:glycerophosphoryl diester phosphodiesterase
MHFSIQHATNPLHCMLVAAGAAQIVDPTTGNPLVDGPGPYKRLPARPLDRSRPLVIGHRGSSGEYPEHSELAYRAAVNHGEA